MLIREGPLRIRNAGPEDVGTVLAWTRTDGWYFAADGLGIPSASGIGQRLARGPWAGDRRQFMIESEDGPALGLAEIRGINWPSRVAHVGLFFPDGHLSSAAAVQAGRAFVGYLFETLNLARAHTSVVKRATESIGYLLRVGFRREGTLREHTWCEGALQDEEVLGLLREEFQGKSQSTEGPL